MTFTRRIRNAGSLAVLTLLAHACGGDDDPVGTPASIAVTVSPVPLTVAQGESQTVTASLTRSGGFAGAVSLAVSGLPTGVTATLTPTQLTGATATASLTLIVAAAVAPGTYTATITATAQGVTQASANVPFTVTARPDFVLSLTATGISIAAELSATVTVNIARTNFTGPITLSLVNPPTGITGQFTPASATDGASSLVIAVASTVAAATYPITIQGTATGPGSRTVTLSLTVTPRPTVVTDVEYQFCDVSEAPAFFAFQDGTGAWQPVTGSSSGNTRKFAFQLTRTRGGVVMVWPTASSTISSARAKRLNRPSMARAASMRTRRAVADAYLTEVRYATASQLAEDGRATCSTSQSSKTITANVTGVLAGQYAILSLGGITHIFDGAQTTNPLTFMDVPGGPVDFIATRMTRPGTPPDKAFMIRSLNIPDGGTVPGVIDFTATAMTPARADATMTGAGGDNLEIFVEVVTTNGLSLFWFDLAPSAATTRPWAGVDAAAMQSGDFHGVVVFASPPGNTGSFRVAAKYAGNVSNQTLALGPVAAVPTSSVAAAGSYPRFRFQAPLAAEYNKGIWIDIVGDNSFSIAATSAYFDVSGVAAGYDLTMPDVSTLSGFPAGARLTAGPNEVSAHAFGFSGTGVFDVRPAIGNEFRGSTKVFSIVVP